MVLEEILLIDKQETRIRFIWLSGFRGEEFLEIDQPETRIACFLFVN
jgi:hypothetical protein